MHYSPQSAKKDARLTQTRAEKPTRNERPGQAPASPYSDDLSPAQEIARRWVASAVLVVRAWQDPHARYLNRGEPYGGAWPAFARDPNEAYGYDTAALPREVPSAAAIDACDTVFDLLRAACAGPGSAGARDERIVWLRVAGMGWRRITQRDGRPRYTLQPAYRRALGEMHALGRAAGLRPL